MGLDVALAHDGRSGQVIGRGKATVSVATGSAWIGGSRRHYRTCLAGVWRVD